MADICVVYLSEDEPVVEQLVTLLRRDWDVWWARDIAHGDWEEVVRKEVPKSLALVPVLSGHTRGERRGDFCSNPSVGSSRRGFPDLSVAVARSGPIMASKTSQELTAV
jgi:hypothetical protein